MQITLGTFKIMEVKEEEDESRISLQSGSQHFLLYARGFQLYLFLSKDKYKHLYYQCINTCVFSSIFKLIKFCYSTPRPKGLGGFFGKCHLLNHSPFSCIFFYHLSCGDECWIKLHVSPLNGYYIRGSIR